MTASEEKTKKTTRLNHGFVQKGYMKLIIFKKGVGKLRDATYELQMLLEGLPENCVCDYKVTYESSIDVKYNVKIYRKS